MLYFYGTILDYLNFAKKISMWSDWEQLTGYLKNTFSIKGDLLSVLFLVGIHEAGTGFRAYTQDEKTGLVKLAKYTLLTFAGYFQKIEVADRDPLFIPEEEKFLPADPDQIETILKNELLTYFNHNIPFSS